ncbi:triose-phosphate transporter family-domain-containing protein [Gorgonomyces haynaldii]|nr:triose-phosphate transporter family-domain-containing protein [Gorgonomyces haynaldii]
MKKSSSTVAGAWLLFYFVSNLSLTIYNKAVMQYFQFPFPFLLTMIHALCGSLGCLVFYLCGYYPVKKLNTKGHWQMVLFSLLYTINIAVSNVSLHMVTVPFHQVVRSLVPFFTILMEYCYFQKTVSYLVIGSMIPICLGVGLATMGDYSYSIIGFWLTLLGVFLAALKGIITNKLLVGELKLHPLDLLFRMSPLALIQTLLYGFCAGELKGLESFQWSDMVILALFLNGMIAFGLNVASFNANKHTDALSMGVAGNVKQVLSIVLSIFVFDLDITTENASGILLTLFGGAWYTKISLDEKKRYQSVKTVIN